MLTHLDVLEMCKKEMKFSQTEFGADLQFSLQLLNEKWQSFYNYMIHDAFKLHYFYPQTLGNYNLKHEI